MATSAATIVLSGSAQASDSGGYLCRAVTDAPVFRDMGGPWIYTIAAGHDMRVHSGGGFYYGHGFGHPTDGYAHSEHFSGCR